MGNEKYLELCCLFRISSFLIVSVLSTASKLTLLTRGYDEEKTIHLCSFYPRTVISNNSYSVCLKYYLNPCSCVVVPVGCYYIHGACILLFNHSQGNVEKKGKTQCRRQESNPNPFTSQLYTRQHLRQAATQSLANVKGEPCPNDKRPFAFLGNNHFSINISKRSKRGCSC